MLKYAIDWRCSAEENMINEHTENSASCYAPKQRWGLGTRTEDAEQGQERILAAAVRCYEQKGIATTTIDDVAREAQISRRTVYRYFSSRQTIIQAVVERQAHDFFCEMGKSIGKKQKNFYSLLEHCVLYAIQNGPAISGHDLLLEGQNAMATTRYYLSSKNIAQHWLDILSVPFASAQQSGEVAAHIELQALVSWIGRITLSYIQFPEPIHQIKKQLKMFMCFA